MTHGRKTKRLRGWLSNFFAPKNEIHRTGDGPQLPSGSSTNNQFVEVNNAIYVQGVGNTVMRQEGQGDRNLVSQGMALLLQHIIRGAAHNDSARYPPPRCHPNTRLRLIARITTWFNGQARQELLLWITGPAGVGKSAVVQTFAEYLAKNHLLGACVFISRPNRRNNPHGIFVTLAYQLSIRIEAYRNFITEQLSIDPELLDREMAAQFVAFIVEPFVEKKIGAGGQRWGILLDGLDELEGEDTQCEIIQLITTFVFEHRDTPLVWIIASRPEPHISNTFADNVNRSHWSEYIPIDSTESCEDVERFLRSSFETTQKKYRQCVPRDWPSETDLLKVTVAASGLFVYAEVVMEFIRDPTQADPAARLELISSIIDRSNASPTKDNPFVHLDALYKAILSAIPSAQWPTTKRLLSYVIHGGGFDSGDSLRTLGGLAILFDLPPHVIYACLLKCHSTLRVPNWNVAHQENLTFLHASFSDFLKDPTRSGDLHAHNAEDVKSYVTLRVFDIWDQCSRDTASMSMESTWHQHCSKWDDGTQSNTIAEFHINVFRDIVTCLMRVVDSLLSRRAKDPVLYARLHEIDMIKLCYSFSASDSGNFVNAVMTVKSNINDTELIREVQLKDLEFGHLNLGRMNPARAHFGTMNEYGPSWGGYTPEEWILRRPHSSTDLETFVFEVESLQERLPQLKAVILGGVREGRIAAFRHCLDDGIPRRYIIPYPE